MLLATQLLIMTSRKLSLNEVLELLNQDEEFFDDAQEVIQEGSDEEFDAEEVEDSDDEEIEDLENGDFDDLQEFQQGIL